MKWPDRQQTLELAGRFFYHGLRLGLALMFVAAGALKLRDPQAFAHAIAQYELIPDRVIPLLALGLPAVEVLAGLGLVLDRRGSLALVAGLVTMFLGVLGYAMVKDLNIDCGCFTLEEMMERTTVRQAFVRDVVMLGAIAVLYGWKRAWAGPTLKKLELEKEKWHDVGAKVGFDNSFSDFDHDGLRAGSRRQKRA